MEAKCLMVALGLALIAFFNVEASADHKLVVYWGQNAVYNMKKEKQYWEKPLTHFCQQSSYDVVVLAFMHVFFDSRQKEPLVPGIFIGKLETQVFPRPGHWFGCHSLGCCKV